MLNSVFFKTIRDIRGQIVGWGIGLAAMAAVTVLVYPTFQNMVSLEGFIKSLPPAMQKLVGGQATLGVFEEFLNLKLFDAWLPIILSVFTIVHGAAAIAGEEERRTMDLLMANPVKRWRVVVEKFAATAAAVTGISALVCLGLAAGVVVTGIETSIWRLWWAAFSVVPITLVFGAVSLAGSCFFRRRKHAVAVAVVLLIASYFIYAIGPLSDTVQPWLKLSFFHYYSRTEPIGREVDPGSSAVLWLAMGVIVAGAVAAFQRKDLAV